jgi:hypothetical protein
MDNKLIELSLIYYDTQKEKYKKYYKNNITLNLINEDNNLNLPFFNLKNKDKILLEGNFNIIGHFNKGTHKFIWGWYITFKSKKNDLIKNNTYYVKQIINYILDLNINDKKYIKERKIYNILLWYFLNPIVSISNPTQLEIILALTLYITKSDMIYKIYNKKDNIDQYYILKNIKKIYN